jgi:hypothetical protein
VRYAEQSLIILGHLPNGVALGIPVTPQTGPRHRSHVPLSAEQCSALGLRPRASVIATQEPTINLSPKHQPSVLGCCSTSLLMQIADTIRRARFASTFESAMTPMPWWS